MEKKRVLFVCVGNSCRSQMAEGFARRLGKGALEAGSAGTNAGGFVHHVAVSVMGERGIDISAQRSKQFTKDMLSGADIVVTLGCCRAKDLCGPGFSGMKLDWEVRDPIGMPLDFYRCVRDDIEEKVKELLDAQGLLQDTRG